MLLEAIKLEHEYLQLNGKEADRFHFVHKLSLIGYSLEKYRDERDRFVFEQSPKIFKETNIVDLKDDERDAINSGIDTFLVGKPNQLFIYDGKETQLDLANATHIDVGQYCESISSTDNDIDISVVSRQRRVYELYYEFIVNELAYLEIEPKDILMAEIAKEGYSIYYFHIALEEGEREKVIERWLH